MNVVLLDLFCISSKNNFRLKKSLELCPICSKIEAIIHLCYEGQKKAAAAIIVHHT